MVLLRSEYRRFPIRRASGLGHPRRVPVRIPHGYRRYLSVLYPAFHPPDLALHCLGLGGDPVPGQGIHDRLSRPRNTDGRHFLRARFCSLLHVLRGRAGADVLDHRGMGWTKSDLLGIQIFSLYLSRLDTDVARGNHGLLRDWYNRHYGRANPRLSSGPAEMAMAGFLRLVRGQGSDVAGPHLVARCPRRGADRRFGNPRRHTIEDGRLWFYSLFAADVSARLQLLYATDLHPERHCCDLHLISGACADRHEEARRLLVDPPYGLRHDGHLRGHQRSCSGRGDSDAEPWARLGRALPLCRRPL